MVRFIWQKMKFLAKKDKAEMYKKPALKHEVIVAFDNIYNITTLYGSFSKWIQF